MTVKSYPVYFYVQKEKNFDAVGTKITFEIETLNIGRAMDIDSGVFTAPLHGIYFFSVSAVGETIKSGNSGLELGLFLEEGSENFTGKKMPIGTGKIFNTNKLEENTLSIQSTLELKKGDKLWLELRYSNDVHLRDDSFRSTHFTGFLLDEYI